MRTRMVEIKSSQIESIDYRNRYSVYRDRYIEHGREPYSDGEADM